MTYGSSRKASRNRQKQECTETKDPALYIKEEQVSSDESRPKQKSKERRHRASVACTSCRGRRIRCVVPSGKKTCIQCQRSSTICIIKDDDERRRPISRAYVYSLVERVALLERTLQEHGLTVPPVNHPPETRYRPHQSEETSAESASSFSSTPGESLGSDDHATTSPSSPDRPTEVECYDTKTKRKSSDSSITDEKSSASNKRTRQDSLISSTIVKSEIVADNPLEDSSTQCNGAFTFDLHSPTVPPPQVSFWPMTYDHNGGLISLIPTTSDASTEHRDYSAWCPDAFSFQGYNGDNMISQFEVPLPNTYDIGASCISRRTSTNLDFMPLNSS